MIGKLQEELNTVEERRNDLRRQIGMLEFIRNGNEGAAQELVRNVQAAKGKRVLSPAAREKISQAQKKRHAKAKNKGNNAQNPRWSETDDKVIVTTIKNKGKVAAPEVARLLTSKLDGRTEGAIRQRIARLAESGMLKQSVNGSGNGSGIPHMMVEAV